MTWKNTSRRYGPLSRGLHWMMLLWLIAVYVNINLRQLFPQGRDLRLAFKAVHLMLGLSVLVWVSLRLYARLGAPRPGMILVLAPGQQRSSALVHFALYGLMFCMPVLGWLLLSAAGKSIPFWGLELPALIANNKALAHTIKERHETLGAAGYCLIAAHAAGWHHHYFRRDNTLTRLLAAARLGRSPGPA